MSAIAGYRCNACGTQEWCPDDERRALWSALSADGWEEKVVSLGPARQMAIRKQRMGSSIEAVETAHIPELYVTVHRCSSCVAVDALARLPDIAPVRGL